MSSFILQSACAPVFVPLCEDNTIKFDVIQSYCDYLRKAGISSIFVNGGCGEFSSLSILERKLILESWMKTLLGTDMQVLVNVGSCVFADSVDLGNHALDLGVNALVMVPPFYLPLNSEINLISYLESFIKVLNRPTPLLYYHIPSLTKAHIHLPTFVSLAIQHKLHSLSAIKYTHNDEADLKELVNTIKTVNSHVNIYCGFEPLLQTSVDLDLDGCVLAFVNIMPKEIMEIFNTKDGTVTDGDKKKEKRNKEQICLKVKSAFNEIVEFSVLHKVQLMALLKMAAEISSGISLGPMRRPYALEENYAVLFRGLLEKLNLIKGCNKN